MGSFLDALLGRYSWWRATRRGHWEHWAVVREPYTDFWFRTGDKCGTHWNEIRNSFQLLQCDENG